MFTLISLFTQGTFGDDQNDAVCCMGDQAAEINNIENKVSELDMIGIHTYYEVIW